MPNFEIDGKSYDLETLSDQVKSTLLHIQAIDVEINRMKMLIAVMQTARTAYASSVKEALSAQSAG